MLDEDKLVALERIQRAVKKASRFHIEIERLAALCERTEDPDQCD